MPEDKPVILNQYLFFKFHLTAQRLQYKFCLSCLTVDSIVTDNSSAYTGTVNDKEFRKHLTEKRLEAIRAEVRAEKKPPASVITQNRPYIIT